MRYKWGLKHVWACRHIEIYVAARRRRELSVHCCIGKARSKAAVVFSLMKMSNGR